MAHQSGMRKHSWVLAPMLMRENVSTVEMSE